MARITGTKNITPQTQPANQTVSAPSGNVILVTSSTGGVIITSQPVSGQITNPLQLQLTSTANVNNPFGYIYDPDSIYGNQEQRKAGSAYFPGGVGIEKDLNVGGYIYGRISQATTSSQLAVSSTNTDKTYYPVFTDDITGNGSFLYGDNTPTPGLTYNPSKGLLTTEKLVVNSANVSTSTAANNSLYVKGGSFFTKDITVATTASPANIYVAGDIIPQSSNEWTIGNSDYDWKEAWLEKIYSKTQVTIAPNSGLTEVVGDIRVLGQNPIGTAPVVTNVLYVTVDGDDTNDGRAQDAGRACRTIGGALNSPYYQSGTQILVSAGRYLEDNPLRLKPYTSIRGSDIRTTFIEPINKTQDLFHLESGCYLNYMTFLNGRSGLLEGAYAPGFNRGAYAAAFPPLTGSDKINLFHSPYVQNCTNQGGPWLKDGTMFIPDQTVQVPAAVGTGTWVKGVSTLTVYVGTGTITQGMHINAGQQNPGFFNARTLLLANKPYLQEQVIKYINDQITSNSGNPGSPWYNFDYSKEKCYRDVGILVENTAYDAAFGGNEKSVESGLAYYNGVISVIAGQEFQTTAAIEYLRDRSLEVVKNITCTNTYTGVTSNQVINWVLTGGEVSTSSIKTLYGIVTATIASPSNSPDVYKSTGPDAAFVSAEILMQANRSFIQEDTINYINQNLASKNLKFNKIKCRRDVGLIVDSIALDMAYPTENHSQSTFAGLQYWKQNSYVGDISREITTTTNAMTYLKELTSKIVQNVTPSDDLINRYYSGPTLQLTDADGYESASEDEVTILNKNFDFILDILSGDYLGWSDKIVSNGAVRDLAGVRNAVALLKANRDYMAEEVNAYVTALNPGFVYDVTKCKRDVGYIIDSVLFDLLHGGNRQSVQSGLSYYGYNITRNIDAGEKAATTASFNQISIIADYIVRGIPVPVTYQTTTEQVITGPFAGATESAALSRAISTITNIVWNGTTTVSWNLVPISTATNIAVNSSTAFNLLLANKEFIQDEIIAWLDTNYNSTSFNYNEA